MGIPLDCLNAKTCLSELEEQGIQVRNISATFDINGEFDRRELAEDLPNSVYDPEKHRSLVYRSPHLDGLVILLPPAGRASLTGAATGGDIILGVQEFMSTLSEVGVSREYAAIEVENVVATADLGYSLKLDGLTVELGLESTEYEPEQFPGLIYRSPDGPIALLYSTGKVVLTKTRTYAEILSFYKNLRSQIDALETERK